MLSKPDKLWVRIMKAKHSCGVNVLPSFEYKANSTSTRVHTNMIWVVRNGRYVRFWQDSWILARRYAFHSSRGTRVSGY